MMISKEARRRATQKKDKIKRCKVQEVELGGLKKRKRIELDSLVS